MLKIPNYIKWYSKLNKQKYFALEEYILYFPCILNPDHQPPPPPTPSKKGDNVLFIALLPITFYNTVFYSLAWQLWGFLLNFNGCFDWFIKLSVQTFQPLMIILGRGYFCIINRDLHQFICHCLIPLDTFRASNLPFPKDLLKFFLNDVRGRL